LLLSFIIIQMYEKVFNLSKIFFCSQDRTRTCKIFLTSLVMTLILFNNLIKSFPHNKDCVLIIPPPDGDSTIVQGKLTSSCTFQGQDRDRSQGQDCEPVIVDTGSHGGIPALTSPLILLRQTHSCHLTMLQDIRLTCCRCSFCIFPLR
jgi:hypothetical protein